MNNVTPTSLISITNAEFHEIVDFVYKKFGIDLSKKRQLIEGRLSYTLKSKSMSSFGQYMKMILDDKTGEEMHLFLNKITTNHSYFGRENEHFNFLLQTALPKLEATRKRDLRIWSAGCSSGQEPYNIAMAIDQHFGSRKSSWDTTILGTDISVNVLTKAKQGIYPEDNLDGLPPLWKKQYFKKTSEGDYQVSEKIRNEVVYKIFNLMDPFIQKKPFDIIFCRNVMIYFDLKTTNRLIEKFYDATADGGYLFIGHSETIDKSNSNYTYLKPATYQKVRNVGGA